MGAVILLELQRAGVAVTTARNSEHGLELARKSRFDLILLDVLLAGSSGFDLCRLLKTDAFLKTLPVIFFTGVPTPQDHKEALSLGAVAYLSKDSGLGKLVERILSEVGLARAAASGNADLGCALHPAAG